MSFVQFSFIPLNFCAIALLFGLTLRGSHSDSSTSISADKLTGLWGTEQIIAPVVKGELTIDARDTSWRATIGGLHTTVQRMKERITFTLPGGAGEFRGRVSKTAKNIIGNWIQPGGINLYGNQYASPVELSEIQPNVWRGIVSPLEHRVSFYLSIQRTTSDTLTAFIRNPEANYYRGRTYRVELKGDSVYLLHPDVPEAGIYDRATDQISCQLLFGYQPLVLTRRTNEHAAGYFPRTGSARRTYVYTPPVKENDGWDIASLSEVGIEEHAIREFIEKILAAVPALDNPLNIHSLLIARHGKIVLEEYFYGFDKNRTHDMRSASKTIVPVLIGIARDRGVKIDATTPVYSLFPEFKPFANWDERKNRITVEDLINMSSGLAIDDADPSSPGNENKLDKQTEQYKYTLDLPVVREPGGDPIYGSASINLAGGVLRNAAGTWIPELLNEYFAQPLQIGTYHMNLMPAGEAYTGGGLYMRPRDQLKLGQLYLNEGIWNGNVVVSKEWVKRSLVRHGNMAPRSEIDANHGYGYAWHFRDCKVGGRTLDYYWAGGNGGQLIIVIPDLDMVVGFTGGDYAEFRKYLRWEIEFMPKYILPAVKR